MYTRMTQHSYRDLPYRMSETSTLFRCEDSGEMHGLTRVRQFTISEAHLVIRPDQAEEELKRCFDLSYYVLSVLGLEGDVTYRLSKWDPANKKKYLGDDEYWNRTQEVLREVLREKGSCTSWKRTVRLHSTDRRSIFRQRMYMEKKIP